MSEINPHGLHHVTAIATDPQANVDFYTRTLGLRLVKQTVNFDSPGNYHLYYGDEQGSPSSLITFFPWPDAPRGRQGAGMSTATAFSVPGDLARLVARTAHGARRRHRCAAQPGHRGGADVSAIRTGSSSIWSPPRATGGPAGTASPTSRPSTRSAACTRSRCRSS